MTINPNSKRRRQCNIEGSRNNKEEGGLWNRWEFLVCMKAAPITDRKAKRPKISAFIRNSTPFFLESAAPRPRIIAPPPLAAQVPRSHSRATEQSSEFGTPALDRGNFLLFPAFLFLLSPPPLPSSSTSLPPASPSPPSTHQYRRVSARLSLSFQMTINPNSKRRRQCSIEGSGNNKEE